MMSLPHHLQQLDAELAALAAPDGEPMLLSELDSFLAGILVCPDLIMPREWLPVVLGQEDENQGVFEDGAALHGTVQLVLKHYNTISRELRRLGGWLQAGLRR